MYEVLTNDNWIISVGTFLPLVGVLAMLFVPGTDEKLQKQILIVTSAATLAVGIWTLALFDYDHSEKLQFFVNEEWISVIRSNYAVGLDGISLPLYVL